MIRHMEKDLRETLVSLLLVKAGMLELLKLVPLLPHHGFGRAVDPFPN
jgi:hypothetical protein